MPFFGGVVFPQCSQEWLVIRPLQSSGAVLKMGNLTETPTVLGGAVQL